MKFEAELQRGTSLKTVNRKFLKKIKKDKPKESDHLFHTAHEEVFNEIDCRDCANCCKTTSPLLQMADIDRLAKSMKINSMDFINKFLKIDEDGDYVFKSSPCPFLLSDNNCNVYENRPKACREYPHTNRKKIQQITSLTLKNSLICPAVVRILDRLRDCQTRKNP